MQTIARLYDNYADAIAVVRALEDTGLRHDSISLIANADAHGRYMPSTASTSGTVDPATETSTTGSGATTGSLLGGALGGGLGLLAGIGALAIPGVGPVVAAGWLVATLAGVGVGAASGGIVGSLAGAGVSHDEATVYEEGVKRGGTLVTARVEDTEVAQAEAIMHQHGAVDWRERQTSYADPSYVAPTAAGRTGTVYPDPDSGVTGRPITDDLPGERKTGIL